MDISGAKRQAPLVRAPTFSNARILLAGVLSVLVAGASWALFSARLHLDGHAPARVLPPFTPETYYRAQAWFVTPLLIALWLALTWVAHRLTGGAQRGPFAILAGWLGIAYGAALLVCFLGPEWLVYLDLGIEGVRLVMRYTAPLLAVGAWTMTTLVLRSVRVVPLRRALGVSFVALLAQALLGAPWLR